MRIHHFSLEVSRGEELNQLTVSQISEVVAAADALLGGALYTLIRRLPESDAFVLEFLGLTAGPPVGDPSCEERRERSETTAEKASTASMPPLREAWTQKKQAPHPCHP